MARGLKDTSSTETQTKSTRPWSKEIKQQAKDLFGQGKSVEQINEEVEVPVATLQSWRYRYGWKEFKSQVNSEAELEVFEDSISTITAAKRQLLRGYQLISLAGQDGVIDDDLKFRDKKQAVDTLLAGLKGQVEVRGAEISREFLIDIAKIIQEEVTDEFTLRRIGEKLVALGRLYNQRSVVN
jgi:transposase-like protein